MTDNTHKVKIADLEYGLLSEQDAADFNLAIERVTQQLSTDAETLAPGVHNPTEDLGTMKTLVVDEVRNIQKERLREQFPENEVQTDIEIDNDIEL